MLSVDWYKFDDKEINYGVFIDVNLMLSWLALRWYVFEFLNPMWGEYVKAFKCAALMGDSMVYLVVFCMTAKARNKYVESYDWLKTNRVDKGTHSDR